MKKNRIAAGILAIACGFCISGCGDTGESSSAVSETTTTIAEAETQGETEAQAETEAQTEKPASDAKFAFEVVSTAMSTDVACQAKRKKVTRKTQKTALIHPIYGNQSGFSYVI